jgi:putrescine transport system ATP-binding protein
LAGNAAREQINRRSGGLTMSLAPDADPAAEPLVRFIGVAKRFRDVVALDRLSLDIRRNEFFALLGPSGCGKTTLLRILAGLETADEGRLLLCGRDIGSVPPYLRPINMMFQNYALFPHLSVARNIAFGLRQEHMPKAAIAARVDEMLALVKLDGLGSRMPDALSGGQRQRVALARSLAKRPQVLLLDEPLAALDRKLRGETQFELMELQARLGTTFIIVTHDQDEAMTLAHRMAVMDCGRLVQVASPREIYEQPESRWVAQFLGEVNLIEGGVIETGAGEVVVGDGSGRRLRVAAAAAPGARVALALRPEKLRITTTSEPPEDDNVLRGTVADIGYLGGVSIYKVVLADGAVMKVTITNVARHADWQIGQGEEVWLSWPSAAAIMLTK